MGKKSGRNSGETKEGAAKAAAFLLRIAMHCRCHGCDDKIRAGVKELTLHHGIEALDQTALWTKGELRVVSTADPEKLLRRLHKATGKTVDLIIPKPPAADKEAAAKKEAAAAAAMDELLRRSLLQQQAQYGGGGYASQVLPGAGWSTTLQQPAAGGYAGAVAAYPWAVQPEAAYLSAYPSAGAGGAWGGYAYPSAPAQLGYGGGYAPY
ncbi:unnamed protein product [Urochloa humidicola]